MSLAERLEEAASELPSEADAIRPANGDPSTLLHALDRPGSERLLGWMLENAPAEADELATDWLDEPEGAELIVGLDDSDLSKPGRKVLRRLLHRARSRGLEVQGSKPEAQPRVARLPKIDAPLDEAYVAPLDPRGARLAYLVEAIPSGGGRVFEALLDTGRGLLDFQVYRAGRSGIRSFLKDVRSRERYGAVPATPAAVRALIRQHIESHPEDRPWPKNFSEWRRRFSAVEDATSDDERAPAEHVRVALPTTDADGTEEVINAIREQVFGPWPTGDRARIEDAIGKIRVAMEGIGTDGFDSAFSEASGDVIETLYDEEERRLVAVRLEEAAYVAWQQENEGLARSALVAADELSGEAAGGSAVLSALAETLLASLATELRERAQSDAKVESS